MFPQTTPTPFVPLEKPMKVGRCACITWGGSQFLYDGKGNADMMIQKPGISALFASEE